MFKLVVLFAVVAVASAAPGFLHSAIALPVATSHSSRIDIHSKPIITYSAPALVHAPILKTVVAAPVISAPVVGLGYGHGIGGYGHGYSLGGYGGYGYDHGGYDQGLYGHGGYGHYW